MGKCRGTGPQKLAPRVEQGPFCPPYVIFTAVS